MDKKIHIPKVPDGYTHHQHLFKDWPVRAGYPFWLLLIWANLLALIPLTAGILLLWVPYQIYRIVNTPYALYPALTLSMGWSIGLGLIIVLASMFIHEWLHGVTLTWLGYKPRYAFNKYYLLATVEDGTYLPRRDYLLMTLAPLLVMSLVGGGLLLFLPPALGQLALIALLLNTAASLGDIFVALRVYQSPRDAIFSDDQGIQVFIPASQ